MPCTYLATSCFSYEHTSCQTVFMQHSQWNFIVNKFLKLPSWSVLGVIDCKETRKQLLQARDWLAGSVE